MANQDFRVKNGLQVGLGASVVGIVTAESFSGSGVGLTSLPSASLTGTISTERLSGTYNIDITELCLVILLMLVVEILVFLQKMMELCWLVVLLPLKIE